MLDANGRVAEKGVVDLFEIIKGDDSVLYRKALYGPRLLAIVRVSLTLDESLHSSGEQIATIKGPHLLKGVEVGPGFGRGKMLIKNGLAHIQWCIPEDPFGERLLDGRPYSMVEKVI